MNISIVSFKNFVLSKYLDKTVSKNFFWNDSFLFLTYTLPHEFCVFRRE